MEGSGDISSAIKVLTSRIQQVNHILGDFRVIVLSGMIVDNCSIGSSSRNSIKTEAFVVLLFVSASIHVQSCLILVNLVKLGTPGPEFSHGDTISNVASSETLHFFISANCPIETDTIPFDRFSVLDGIVNIVIKC